MHAMQASTDKMLFNLPDFMATSSPRKSENQRPRTLHSTRSFTKAESPNPVPLNRTQRASTTQNGMTANTSNPNPRIRGTNMSARQPDSFEKMPEEDEGATHASEKLPADFDELPIELVSLTDRWEPSAQAI